MARVQTFLEDSWKFLTKLNTLSLYDPIVTLLNTTKEVQTYAHKKLTHENPMPNCYDPS